MVPIILGTHHRWCYCGVPIDKPIPVCTVPKSVCIIGSNSEVILYYVCINIWFIICSLLHCSQMAKLCNCAFVSGPIEHLNLTQETNIYKILGKLSNGTRLYTNSSRGVRQSDPECKCFNTRPFGNSSVLIEAARVGRNVTAALVNSCNCTISLTVR